MSQFKKGQSGNARGRPPGIPSHSAKLRQVIVDDLPGILAAMVEKAKGGDVGAANLLLSRCLAPLRPQSEPEEVSTPGITLAERAEGISAAALGGELSPSVAVEMMGILAQETRILETTELTQRIERLENALAATKGKK